MNLLSYLWVIPVLGIIIFIHEAGHLIVAKAFGVRVMTFSLGFGKRLFGFVRGETDYRVSLVPLGGYVRLGGENPDEVSDDPREFLNKPRWQRILVYLAGPVMNFVLAIVLMTGLFMVGTVVASNIADSATVVGAVEPGSAAEAAGLKVGDRIVSADGEPVETWAELALVLGSAPGRTLQVAYERAGQAATTTLTPKKVEPYGYGDAGVFPQLQPQIVDLVPGRPAEKAGLQRGDELVLMDGSPVADSDALIAFLQKHPGQQITLSIRRSGKPLTITLTPEDEGGVGKIGATIGYYVRYPFFQAVGESVRYTGSVIRGTMQALGRIVTGKASVKSSLSGPIDIARMSGEAAQQGSDRLLYLIVVLSISIGLFNLFPIPLLDGGQIFLLLIESLRRRDLSLAVKERIQQVGFYVIVALMASVILLDVAKRIP